MKVFIIDDEQLAVDSLKGMLERIGRVQIAGTYTNPIEALEDLDYQRVDAVFLDNEMGPYNGIQVAKDIKAKHPEINIVFVTAFEKFAVDAFAVRAVDYLLKPVGESRLKETLNRLQELDGRDEEMTGLTDSPMLIINVMGSVKLRDNRGNEVKWRTKKVKELFVYLWDHYPSGVHRSRILEDLWPEQYAENAAQLMHTTLYQLRKILRNSGFQRPIQLVNEKYVLNVDGKSDMEKIEQVLASKKMTTTEIERIIHLYVGDYVEEEGYTWASYKQRQLKTVFLTTLEAYVREEIGSDNLSLLVELCLEKMVELEPYNEHYAYLLIDYYGKKKNLQKIIKVADHFENVWKKELDIEIPKEITNIYHKYIQRLAIDTK